MDLVSEFRCLASSSSIGGGKALLGYINTAKPFKRLWTSNQLLWQTQVLLLDITGYCLTCRTQETY